MNSQVFDQNGGVRNGMRFIGTMGDVLVKLRLFLCSFAPLFLICGIRFESFWLSLVCYLLTAIGILLGLLVLGATSRITPTDYIVKRVEDRGPEVAGYLAAYLLPFVTVSQPGTRDVIGYSIFLIVMAVVYIRSEMLQINPTLYLFGWKVMAITTSSGLSAYLLTRRSVLIEPEIRAVRYKNTLLVEH